MATDAYCALYIQAQATTGIFLMLAYYIEVADYIQEDLWVKPSLGAIGTELIGKSWLCSRQKILRGLKRRMS